MIFEFKKGKIKLNRYCGKSIVLLIAIIMSPYLLRGQVEPDSISGKRKGEFVVLPALGYTPETGFLGGAFTEYYFDVARDTNARMSKILVGGFYTLKNQMFIGISPEIYTKGEKYIFTGLIKYSKFSERDYGLGNDSDAVVVQYDFDKNKIDTLNYLEYEYQSFGIEAGGFRKIKNGLYVGLAFNYEKLWDYDRFRDSAVIIYQDPVRDEFNPKMLSSSSSGIALAMNYDTRKNSNYPKDGTYIQFRSWLYESWLGSDFEYFGITLDARKYLNFYKEQVLALRLINEQRYPFDNSLISKFDMSRVGGKIFARGYYEGTYVDNHMLAFEAEYRIPLWLDPNSSIWQFWKRLGIVVFASGSRVYENWEGISLKNMRFTAGLGGRILLSAEQKVNIRIDIGVGLDPKSDFDKRSIGLYLYIGEAF